MMIAAAGVEGDTCVKREDVPALKDELARKRSSISIRMVYSILKRTIKVILFLYMMLLWELKQD